MRTLIILPLLFFNLFPSKAQIIDTVNLYYEIDEFELSTIHKQTLDTLIQKINSDSSQISILGYTDFLGSVGHNDTLSDNRAEYVKLYFLSKGFNASQIVKSEGRGKLIPLRLPEPINEGIQTDRKVEIIIKTPERPVQIIEPSFEIENLKEGETLTLKNLNFLPGRHILTEKSLPELQKLLTTLERNPRLKIEIQGHICCHPEQGDGYDFDTGENSLSLNRAKYVYDYLIKQGIDPGRLSYIGFGRRKPLVEYEVTEEDRNKNRRVEIKILEK